MRAPRSSGTGASVSAASPVTTSTRDSPAASAAARATAVLRGSSSTRRADTSSRRGWPARAQRTAVTPVVLYRIEGGGHGWPGGPQYLSARVIGRVPRHLDASEILLDMVTVG